MTITLQQYRICITYQFKNQLIKRQKQTYKPLSYSFLFILFLVMSPIFANDINTNYKTNNNMTKKLYKIRDIFSFHHINTKDHNKIMRAINGNINKLNIMQYNKGNSIYQNKDHLLNKIILDNKIYIACISKANLRESCKSNNNILIGYQCETKPMSHEVDLSRNIILINE